MNPGLLLQEMYWEMSGARLCLNGMGVSAKLMCFSKNNRLKSGYYYATAILNAESENFQHLSTAVLFNFRFELSFRQEDSLIITKKLNLDPESNIHFIK
jgi:hypothetical protein